MSQTPESKVASTIRELIHYFKYYPTGVDDQTMATLTAYDPVRGTMLKNYSAGKKWDVVANCSLAVGVAGVLTTLPKTYMFGALSAGVLGLGLGIKSVRYRECMITVGELLEANKEAKAKNEELVKIA